MSQSWIDRSFDPTDNSIRVKWNITTSASDVLRVKNATDNVTAFTYLDQWLADERINTIVYSSVIEWLTFTETFAYAWGAWAYVLISITTS